MPKKIIQKTKSKFLSYCTIANYLDLNPCDFFHFHANYDTLNEIFIFVYAYTHEDQADEDIF